MQERAEHGGAALAEQMRTPKSDVSRRHAVVIVNCARIEPDDLDLRGATRGVEIGRREDHYPGLGLAEQRDRRRGRRRCGVTITASGSGREPALGAPPTALGIARHPPVALRAHRPGAGHHGVDAFAQPVEHLPVAVVADRPGAAEERGPPVGGGDEVDERVRAVAAVVLRRGRAQLSARSTLTVRCSGSSCWSSGPALVARAPWPGT